MSRKRPLPGQKRNLLFKQPAKWEKTDGSTYSINQSQIKVCFSIVFLVHFP